MSILLKSSKHFNLVCVYKFGTCVIDLCLAPLLDSKLLEDWDQILFCSPVSL